MLTGDLLDVQGDKTLAAIDAQLVRAERYLAVGGDNALPVSDLILDGESGPLGDWAEVLREVDLEGVSGRRCTLAGEELPLVVGSRGVIGKVTRAVVATVPRPTAALLVRGKESLDLSALRPSWTVWKHGSLTAGFLGSDDYITQVDAGLPIAAGGLAIARQALMEDEGTRSRLWQWPGDTGERLRIHLPASSSATRLRDLMFEARVMAWVSQASGGLTLARVPSREVGGLERIVGSAGGWVERVERAPEPAEVVARHGALLARRFEELRLWAR